MIGKDNPKTAIDPEIDEQIPSVVISGFTPDRSGSKKQPSDADEGNIISVLVKRTINFFFDFLETIVVALSIFVVVYLFFVQPHEVKGSSMEPNFHNNEYILTDKISYRLSEPERGDVVIFKAPNNPDYDYIKRVIGLPGEKISIHEGYVYVNDIRLEEDYLHDITSLFPNSQLKEGSEIIISDDEYFVMGDNRPHSSDSREFGPISKNLIVGKAFLRYWPITDFGMFEKVRYNIN